MIVASLWATVAIAGVNEDFLEAAARGDLPSVKSFFAKGADVNAKAYRGGTELIFASENGHKDVVQLLLAKGANVNAKTNNGGTALLAASQTGLSETGERTISNRLKSQRKSSLKV